MNIKTVDDWIAEIGLKCDGKFFAKDWPEDDTVPVTVADIRKLMDLDWEDDMKKSKKYFKYEQCGMATENKYLCNNCKSVKGE